MDYTDQQFELEHLDICARVWGQGKAHKVIALHGWLDNCASFNELAPLLDAHVVALDMAGHGLSGHRSHMAPYNIWEDVVEIFAVADRLGWESFSLVGHSRGAMVAAIAAGAWPGRVEHLVLLDGIWPEPTEESMAPQQLSRSVKTMLSPKRKKATLYASRDKAIEARMNSVWSITRQSSEALAERGVIAQGDGYIWRADPKLQLPSAVKLSRGQIDAFMQAITAQTLLVLAQDGVLAKMPNLVPQLANYPSIKVAHLPGKHHFHLEGQASHIAELISQLVAVGAAN